MCIAVSGSYAHGLATLIALLLEQSERRFGERAPDSPTIIV